MVYLLDTSTLLELLRASPPKPLIRRISQTSPRERCTSVITVSQILVAARREKTPRLMQDVVRLVAAIAVVPYDLSAAQNFAKFRSTVASPSDTDEVMTAAIAVSRDLTLVTRRGIKFNHYPNLRIEDWTI